MIRLGAAIGLTALVAIVASASLSNRGQSGPAGYAPDLERGAAIYAEACAACHGARLEGAPEWRIPGPDGRLPAPPHDASGHTWHHPDRVLMEITLHGSAAVVGGGYESNMPGFADTYSEDELRDVLEWIKTHWPERMRAHQAKISAEDTASN